MEKGLFFNALPDEESVTGYDRNYNADDISEWLAVVWENGVVKDGLKVEVASGLTVNVNVGRAAIRGKAYVNTAIKPFILATAPTGTTSRYDYIVLKCDNNISARKFSLELRTGTSEKPTVANLIRNTNVYELMIACIEVKPNATSLVQSNIADLRGDSTLCPWFTAVKGYDGYYDAMVQTYESNVTLSAASTTVITTLPSNLYNDKYSVIEVYTNGIREPKTAYTTSLSGGYIVITFTSAKAAQAKITVDLSNYIDGEGMSTAIAQYTEFTQAVADLQTANEYNYVCNGVNDNILISNIVKAFYSVNDYKSLKLNVIGNIGMTAAVIGNGSSTNPYMWFDFTKQVETNRVVTVDFTNASAINPTIADGSINNIFKAEEVKIIGANIMATNVTTSTTVKVFATSTGRIYAENCRFWLTTYTASVIAHTGTFVNCRGSVTNSVGNSYCFLTATSGLLRLYGGEYYAYTGDSNMLSAVLGQSGADAVSILYGVNAPTNARSNYYQTNSIYQAVSGGMINCTDLISALPLLVREGISNIRGTIAKSKIGLL